MNRQCSKCGSQLDTGLNCTKGCGMPASGIVGGAEIFQKDKRIREILEELWTDGNMTVGMTVDEKMKELRKDVNEALEKLSELEIK